MSKDIPTRKKEVIDINSERFRLAREEAGYEKQEVALVFGYKNAAHIYQIEQGQRPVPNWLIRDAASLFSTTTDYFYGLTDEMEVDPVRAAALAHSRGIKYVMDSVASKVADSTYQYLKSMHPLSAETVAEKAKEVSNALASIRVNNKIFDEDIKGGSRLVSAVFELRMAADRMNKEIKRRNSFLDKLPDEIKSVPTNLILPFGLDK